MEILGIGPLELLFIIVLALIFIGPRDMGKYARTVGRSLNQLYRSQAWQDLTRASRGIRGLPNRLAREAALEELDQVHRELREEVSSEIGEVRTAIEEPLIPEPSQDDPEE